MPDKFMEQGDQLSASEGAARKAAGPALEANRLVIQVENATKAFQTPDQGRLIALATTSGMS